jgi:hypothetical protein
MSSSGSGKPKPSGSKRSRSTERGGSRGDTRKTKEIRKESKFTDTMDNAMMLYTHFAAGENGDRIQVTDWNLLDQKYRKLFKGCTDEEKQIRIDQLVNDPEWAAKRVAAGKSDGKKFRWDKEPDLDREVMAAGRARDQHQGSEAPKWREMIKNYPLLRKAVNDGRLVEEQIRSRYNQETRKSKKS